jgi:hypothetical protein
MLLAYKFNECLAFEQDHEKERLHNFFVALEKHAGVRLSSHHNYMIPGFSI